VPPPGLKFEEEARAFVARAPFRGETDEVSPDHGSVRDAYLLLLSIHHVDRLGVDEFLYAKAAMFAPVA